MPKNLHGLIKAAQRRLVRQAVPNLGLTILKDNGDQTGREDMAAESHLKGDDWKGIHGADFEGLDG